MRICLRCSSRSAHPRSDLPAPETKLQILTLAIGRLTRAGYLYIGMDHFAKPQDELAVAQRQGRLQRNFPGLLDACRSRTCSASASRRSAAVGPTYCQNLEAPGRLLRGARCRPPAGLARHGAVGGRPGAASAVIQALACHFRVSIESIELAHLGRLPPCVRRRAEELKQLADDGLVEISRTGSS
jgi:oxygen-independent coproporphyrinogen-3 oxidase